MRARDIFLALACIAAIALGVAARADTAPAFSPAQRSEIVGIVRAALKTDPSILRDAITALQAEERDSQQVAARAAISRVGPALSRADGDPTGGVADGDVTLVEFYDLRCPYCRKMLPVIADLLRIEPRLRVVYKDIPILGPGSVLGARAVLAAQRQGGYLRLRDAIMTGPAQITDASVAAACGQAALNCDRLRHDMTDPSIQARLDSNLALARQLGIDGTPAYVVGARLIHGAVSLDDLRNAVAAARAS